MALFFSLLDTRLHDRTAFSCGEPSLDVYLRERAGQHQRDGIATTHVLAEEAHPAKIVGYCSLAAAQITLAELHEADRSQLPRYPVPAVRVARLAVDTGSQRTGIGQLLLGQAANCALDLRAQLGVRMLIVDALNEKAAAFYRLHGFRDTTGSASTLYLPLGRA
jgi:GNAT superfamily N-acetyltransferase